jgi:DNA-binding transcriptional ArsR family regulator
MVERQTQLDLLFHALAHSVRRDILSRVSQVECTLSELARPYAMTFAAIAKHIAVLERANLVRKERRGKEQVIYLTPQTIQIAEEHIARYSNSWNERFDQLERILAHDPKETQP